MCNDIDAELEELFSIRANSEITRLDIVTQLSSQTHILKRKLEDVSSFYTSKLINSSVSDIEILELAVHFIKLKKEIEKSFIDQIKSFS